MLSFIIVIIFFYYHKILIIYPFSSYLWVFSLRLHCLYACDNVLLMMSVSVNMSTLCFFFVWENYEPQFFSFTSVKDEGTKESLWIVYVKVIKDMENNHLGWSFADPLLILWKGWLMCGKKWKLTMQKVKFMSFNFYRKA